MLSKKNYYKIPLYFLTIFLLVSYTEVSETTVRIIYIIFAIIRR
ncbi:hypothetical protein HMPREF1982_04488 [Clostridiales bacterium oral taxon 876 str. F0540]|nr:hypothetical protein HMPREF1982_04488 [Clostridiales bacterium oral taxon 876 str. F0540]